MVAMHSAPDSAGYAGNGYNGIVLSLGFSFRQ